MSVTVHHPFSTAIEAMAYDDESGELTITFSDGRSYSYENFPEDVLTQWLAASSQGTFFNLNVRGKYDPRAGRATGPQTFF